MNSYSFSVSCPRCGGDVEHRRSVQLGTDHSQSEVWCGSCLIVWRLDVGMTNVDDLGHLFVGLNGDQSLRERAGTALDDERLRVFE